MTADPMSEWFHQAALAVGFIAAAEGWLGDSERVRRVVYHLYEYGEWPESGHRRGPGRGAALPALQQSTQWRML